MQEERADSSLNKKLAKIDCIEDYLQKLRFRIQFMVSRLIDAHMHWHAHEELDPKILYMIRLEFPFLFEGVTDSSDPTPLVQMLEKDRVEYGFVINYVAPEVMGFTFNTNDWVIDFCDRSGGKLIPVGGVDTKAHPEAGNMLKPYFETDSLKMVKVHGPHQLINPNDYLYGNDGLRNLYETCEEFKIPVLFHTGSSIFPKARSRFGNPLLLEDVLIDFPDLKVIIAHGGRPFWTREFEYLMIKYPGIYFDISGVPPKLLSSYFPRIDRYADRIVFGSDFPSPGVKGIRKNAELLENELQTLGFGPEILKRIFFENAREIVGL